MFDAGHQGDGRPAIAPRPRRSAASTASCSATPTPTTAARRPGLQRAGASATPPTATTPRATAAAHYFDFSQAPRPTRWPSTRSCCRSGTAGRSRSPARSTRATTSPASASCTSRATRPGMIALFRERDRRGADRATASTCSTRARPPGPPRLPHAGVQPGHRAGARVDPQARRRSSRGAPGPATPSRSPATSRAQLERAAARPDGRRSRRRGQAAKLDAPRRRTRAPGGDVLVLRGAMTPGHAARVRRRRAAGSPLSREDAWQRAVEFLFERLAVALGDRRHRADHAPEGAARRASASPSRDERQWIRDVAARAPRRALPGARGAVRIVDLSVLTGPGPGEPLPPAIEYEDHGPPRRC